MLSVLGQSPQGGCCLSVFCWASLSPEICEPSRPSSHLQALDCKGLTTIAACNAWPCPSWLACKTSRGGRPDSCSAIQQTDGNEPPWPSLSLPTQTTRACFSPLQSCAWWSRGCRWCCCACQQVSRQAEGKPRAPGVAAAGGGSRQRVLPQEHGKLSVLLLQAMLMGWGSCDRRSCAMPAACWG